MIFSKKIKTVSFLFILISCLYSCNSKNVIKIFNQNVPLSSPVKEFEHEQPFLKLIEVEKLFYNSIENLTEKDMTICISALTAGSDQPVKSDGAFLIFVYTIQDSGSFGTINIDDTQGFSILRSVGSKIEHDYFEKYNATKFRRIPSLSMSLHELPELEEVRLLHFASSGSYRLPSRSTIYEFRSRDFKSNNWQKQEDKSLRIATLLDFNRSWGAPTLGLFGSEIYLALAGKDGSFCGGNGKCPVGKKNCGYPDAGTGMVCGGNPTAGLFIQIAQQLRAVDFSPAPLDFVLFRSLRKGLLENSLKGREYISYYYIASLFLRFDPSLLETYSLVLPQLQDAFARLEHGADETVVMTRELEVLLNKIIVSHRNVKNNVFQKILDVFQKDFENIQGMTKARLVAYFSNAGKYNVLGKSDQK